nr:MAG TPA: tail tube protein [Caudoviricetes sp.]
MEDIKPREVAWRFDGRDWVLRCNNNVLAEVQEINGGDFSPILSTKRTLKSVLQLLAAMLNDYADEQKWVDEKGFAIRYTEKQLGRRLSLGTANRLAPDVMRMAILAVRDAETENSSADEKNAETRQEEAAVSTSPGT